MSLVTSAPHAKRSDYKSPVSSALPAAPRLRTGGPSWFVRFRGRRGLFLAFQLRQALLKGRHQVHNRSQLFRLLDRCHFAALEFGLDQLLQIFLEAVLVFLRVPFIG